MKIILIDLILHKTKAYRHLLFSVINQRRVNFEVFSSADTRGCLCWKLYVYLCFSSFNEAVAKHIDSNLQVNVCFSIKLFISLIYFLELQYYGCEALIAIAMCAAPCCFGSSS